MERRVEGDNIIRINDTVSGHESPMVSVVMVAYNSERYIDEAISGVVGQRCRFGVQLVICDDASTDTTPGKVEKWRMLYPEIIDYHRNPHNLGVQGNYLETLRHCRGKYITMCDADDYWCDSSKLRRQVEYMENHPSCSLCYHRVVNYYEEDGEMSLSNGGGAVEQSAAGLASRNTITNLSVMYRASLYDLAALPSWLGEIRLIDYALHMLFASRGEVHYINRPMGVYRHLPSAIWSQAEAGRRIEMAIAVRKKLIGYFSDRKELCEPLEKSCVNMVANFEKTKGKPAQRRPLLSRIRGAVSRLLPRPRPAGDKTLRRKPECS